MKLLPLLTALSCFFATATAGEVELLLDHAKLYSLDRPVGRIIVGNPAVADVSVQSTTELVLFGKMPGQTSLYVFDKDGNSMGSVSLRVANPRKNMVTIYAGAARTTMSCGRVCEHTFTIGDGVNGLRAQGQDVAAQAQMRFEMASSSQDGPANEQPAMLLDDSFDPES